MEEHPRVIWQLLGDGLEVRYRVVVALGVDQGLTGIQGALVDT
jgi:hypothetical protein